MIQVSYCTLGVVQMGRCRLNFPFSVWMLKYLWYSCSSQRWNLCLFSEAIMFWLEFQFILLSWPGACEAELCPQVLGTFSFSSLLTELCAGLAVNSHAAVLRFVMLFIWGTLNQPTNTQITPHMIPFALLLGCFKSDYFPFPECHPVKLSTPLFVLVSSIKQSSRSSEAAEDEKDQRTVTVNPSHMRKAFKVMNELRRYAADFMGTLSG